MLQIYANDRQLDTAGVKFNITLKNPMFITGDLEGSYIYNFKLPLTTLNRSVLEFPDRIEKYPGFSTDMDCRITFDGIPIVDQSTITVKYTGGNFLTANVKCGIGHIFYKLKDKLLSDIDLGGVRNLCGSPFIPIDYYNETVAGSYPDYDFVLFPVQNTEFYKDTNVDDNWKNNIQIVNYYLNGSFRQGLSSGDPTGGTFTPFPYIVYILNQIFGGYGYASKSNVFLQNGDLRRLVLYNNYADTVTVAVPDPGPPPTVVYSSKANHNINLANQVPQYSVLDFLGDLRVFALAYFVDSHSRSFDIKFLNDIIRSADYIDYTDRTAPLRDIDHEKANGYKFSWEVSSDGWAGKYLHRDLSRFTIKDPVATVLDLPFDEYNEINDVRLVIDQDVYYIFRWDEASSGFTWNYFSYRFNDVESGSDPFWEMKSKISPLMVDKLADQNAQSPTRSWLVPVIEQSGSNKFFLNSEYQLHFNDPGKRFLFYRGMHQDSIGGSYPLGTNDVYNYAGDKIADANLSLKWEGAYGLYLNLWKTYLNWYINVRKLVTFSRIFAAPEIRNLDFSKKHRIDGTDYLIKEIKIPVTEKEILPAKMDCYRV